MRKVNLLFLVLFLLTGFSTLSAHNLEESIASSDRTPAFATRDVYRHPYETLSFFGIKPDMTSSRIKSWRRVVHRDIGKLHSLSWHPYSSSG